MMSESQSRQAKPTNGNPWDDKELVEEKYIGEKKSTIELADEWGCAPNTVRDRLERFDIPIRSQSEAMQVKHGNYSMAVPIHVKQTGAVRWTHNHNSQSQTIFVHRLLAVSEYGFEAVRDNVVHHKNEIRWDNRPANLELMDHADHSSHHKKVPDGERIKIANRYENTEDSSYTIAEDYEICAATVRYIHNEVYNNE